MRGRWSWQELPTRVEAANRRVQEALGGRATYRSGHPDVAAMVGGRPVYVECKVADEPTATQVQWLAAAVDHRVVAVRDYVIVQASIAQA